MDWLLLISPTMQRSKLPGTALTGIVLKQNRLDVHQIRAHETPNLNKGRLPALLSFQSTETLTLPAEQSGCGSSRFTLLLPEYVQNVDLRTCGISKGRFFCTCARCMYETARSLCMYIHCCVYPGKYVRLCWRLKFVQPRLPGERKSQYLADSFRVLQPWAGGALCDQVSQLSKAYGYIWHCPLALIAAPTSAPTSRLLVKPG